jgi:hypothetical protein
MCDLGQDGWCCTNIYYITAAENVISSQLSSSCQGRRYGPPTRKAGAMDRPSHYKSHLPDHSPPAKLGRTLCRSQTSMLMPALWISPHVSKPLLSNDQRQIPRKAEGAGVKVFTENQCCESGSECGSRFAGSACFEPPGSGSISQRHGSADPEPHQNVMEPQHCRKPFIFCV